MECTRGKISHRGHRVYGYDCFACTLSNVKINCSSVDFTTTLTVEENGTIESDKEKKYLREYLFSLFKND